MVQRNRCVGNSIKVYAWQLPGSTPKLWVNVTDTDNPHLYGTIGATAIAQRTVFFDDFLLTVPGKRFWSH
jgi:hypothetical protein